MDGPLFECNRKVLTEKFLWDLGIDMYLPYITENLLVFIVTFVYKTYLNTFSSSHPLATTKEITSFYYEPPQFYILKQKHAMIEDLDIFYVCEMTNNNNNTYGHLHSHGAIGWTPMLAYLFLRTPSFSYTKSTMIHTHPCFIWKHF